MITTGGTKVGNSLKIENVLFNEEQISNRIKEMGEVISKDYEGKDLIVVSLLRGSFIFAADLVRAISIPVQVDFMTTASYGHSEESTGHVALIHDLMSEIKDKDVLIVDDIIDSGRTLNVVKEMLKERDPRSLKVCTLLDKPSRRTVDINADYVGFEIEDLFIVGYGLNYKDHYRNIPYIFTFDS